MISKMLRIRAIEEEIARRYPEGKMRGPVHLSIGQEAVAVGVCSALTKDDLCVSTHRSHAHYLAKGGNLNRMIAELHGKDTGCSRGHGGSMHLVDRSAGFMGSTSIVGGTIPIGVGLAFAKKLRKEPGIVVVFMGDAALEQGVWHESANFAALHGLAVLFVIENNQFSCFTHINKRQPKRLFHRLAEAHGLPSYQANSESVAGVFNTVKGIHSFPAFIEISTQRFLEHCGPANDDHLGYRDPEMLKIWRDRDELKGLDTSEFKPEIDEAFRLAEEAPWPEGVGMYAD